MTVTESTPSVSVPDHIARQVVLPEGHREDEPRVMALTQEFFAWAEDGPAGPARKELSP